MQCPDCGEFLVAGHPCPTCWSAPKLTTYECPGCARKLISQLQHSSGADYFTLRCLNEDCLEVLREGAEAFSVEAALVLLRQEFQQWKSQEQNAGEHL